MPLTEFMAQIREIMRQEIAGALTAQNTAPKEDLTIDEAAALLGVKKPTVYTYVSKKLIPSYKPGKHLIFKRSELLAFIAASKNSSNGNLAEMAENDFLKANKKGGVIK